MARNVFEEDEQPRAETGVKPTRPAPRRSPLLKGGAAAPKYIQGSTQNASERTHEDIPVNQIQDSLIEDRIDVNEGLDELVESIDKNGQQIPIIVRIVKLDKPYEIVAGRRRLAAIRRLGQPTIRGYITRMSDKEAFIAQGIENSARLETSFIERARAAAKAYVAGFDQYDVAEFLGVSQTLINFMVRIYEALDEPLVLAIGPARGVGRRKWELLTTTARERGLSADDLLEMVDRSIPDSADRFWNLLSAVEAAKPTKKTASRPAPAERTDLLGGSYAMTRKPKQLVIKADRSASDALLNFLSERIPELVEEFEERQEVPDKENR